MILRIVGRGPQDRYGFFNNLACSCYSRHKRFRDFIISSYQFLKSLGQMILRIVGRGPQDRYVSGMSSKIAFLLTLIRDALLESNEAFLLTLIRDFLLNSSEAFLLTSIGAWIIMPMCQSAHCSIFG